MKHFEKHEFACKCGCGLGISDMDPKLLTMLDEIRSKIDRPIRINSAVRCARHNSNESGSKNSEHVPENTHNGKCTAVDVHIPDSAFMYAIIPELYKHGVKRIGYNQKFNFIHIGLSEAPVHPQNVFFKY